MELRRDGVVTVNYQPTPLVLPHDIRRPSDASNGRRVRAFPLVDFSLPIGCHLQGWWISIDVARHLVHQEILRPNTDVVNEAALKSLLQDLDNLQGQGFANLQ
jgi:hypothetical protein